MIRFLFVLAIVFCSPIEHFSDGEWGGGPTILVGLSGDGKPHSGPNFSFVEVYHDNGPACWQNRLIRAVRYVGSKYVSVEF